MTESFANLKSDNNQLKTKKVSTLTEEISRLKDLVPSCLYIILVSLLDTNFKKCFSSRYRTQYLIKAWFYEM